MDGTQFLTVQQAAEHFGVTEKTIRRRIAGGKLNAEKVPTSQGYEWRITIETDTPAEDAPEPMSSPVDNPTVQLDSTDVQAPRQRHTHVETAEDLALLRALELADRMQRENAALQDERAQLRDQLTWLQYQLQDAQKQIRMLTDQQAAKDEPEPEAEPAEQPPPKRVPWYK